nr:ATP-binding cassette domain-containing protein [uncultured Porphyromonas sp.]
MIHVQGLEFGYTRSRKVFRGLGLELGQGSIMGLLGRNGEGKTTLLKLLTGQLLRQSGQLEVLGHDPKRRQVSFLQQVYLLPEEVAVPSISIAKFFEVNGAFYPSYDAALGRELLQIFSLSPEMNLKKISQGQKKKALIAFALALRVPLLLMDEPTNGLDIPSKSEFRRVLAQYTSEEQTIIISTHQVRDLEQIIDSVLVLEQGAIICQATVSEIASRLRFAPVQPGEASQPLYTEQSPLGLLGVFARGADEEAEDFSMELFFNALLAARPAVLSALQSQDLTK